MSDNVRRFAAVRTALNKYYPQTGSKRRGRHLTTLAAMVAGIVAAYLMLHPRVRVWVLVLGRIPLPLTAGIVLGFWLLFQIYSLGQSYFAESTVSWHAHLGGAIAGALLIIVFRRKGVALFDRDLPRPD